MNWTIICIFSILFLIGNVSAAGILRIFKGNDAEIKDFPYQVAIRYSGNHLCGDSIISDRHILTAAHCTFKGTRTEDEKHFKMENYTVHTGISKSDEIGIMHRVRDFHVHPEWIVSRKKAFPNDIAILILEDPIVFDEYHQKINLPSHDVRHNEIANITGWGWTSDINNKFSIPLQKLQVRLFTYDKCLPLISYKIGPKQVCAWNRVGSGVCYGDSGSPLVSNGEVVGITSFVNNKCAYLPDVYTNVFAYKSFIESIIAKE